MAHGQVSVRGHPLGRPGWCGTVVGAAGWLLRTHRAGEVSMILAILDRELRNEVSEKKSRAQAAEYVYYY